jgi:metal-sulfur cluster biosynthetic enzyme
MKMKDKVIEVLKHTQDPELGVDIYTLGLIYDVDVSEDEEIARIKMTFTTPLCPYGPQLVGDIKRGLLGLGLRVADIEVVFDPPWEPTPELREMLGV